jgi:membrane-associated protease RseP (regulator of RpoE activity)
MNKLFSVIAMSSMVAVPAFAHVQQPTPQQRRDIEKRMGELEQEMQDLRRQLGDGPRVRTRINGGPDIMRIGPGGEVFRVMGGRMKFGFGFEPAADSGVRVTTVTPSSPAEKVGLKTGDVVTMFNGVKLTGQENAADALRQQAENLEVGDTVGIEFMRGNEKKSGKMVAEDLGPNGFAYAFGNDSTLHLSMPRMEYPRNLEFGMLPGRWTDIEMVSLNKDLGEYFGTPEGVLVVRAPRDSSLALKSGDVILSIDGRKPTTPPQALRILRSYERGESFDIVVLRQKKKMTLKARVPDRDTHGYFEYKTPQWEEPKTEGN